MIDFFASTKVDIAFYIAVVLFLVLHLLLILKVLHLFLASSYFFFAKVGDVYVFSILLTVILVVCVA